KSYRTKPRPDSRKLPPVLGLRRLTSGPAEFCPVTLRVSDFLRAFPYRAGKPLLLDGAMGVACGSGTRVAWRPPGWRWLVGQGPVTGRLRQRRARCPWGSESALVPICPDKETLFPLGEV